MLNWIIRCIQLTMVLVILYTGTFPGLGHTMYYRLQHNNNISYLADHFSLTLSLYFLDGLKCTIVGQLLLLLGTCLPIRLLQNFLLYTTTDTTKYLDTHLTICLGSIMFRLCRLLNLSMARLPSGYGLKGAIIAVTLTTFTTQ